MGRETTDDPRSAAIEQLEHFGLSAYGVRTRARPIRGRRPAIWGEGETNSLVVVLKAIFNWRLDTADPD